MAKWTTEKIQQRVIDLQQRLEQGQTLAQIARDWGTSKQNVSQFKARYLPGSSASPPPTAEPRGEAGAPSEARQQAGREPSSLYTQVYAMLAARDERISELEQEILRLKARLYAARYAEAGPSPGKADLERYVLGHQPEEQSAS